MKTLEKIDNFFDMLIRRDDKIYYLKKLKKICRKNYVPKDSYKKYFNQVDKLFNLVYAFPRLNTPIDEIDALLSNEQILCRVYELTKEFLLLGEKELSHSSNALVRQLIELFLIHSLLKEDPDYCCLLTGNPRKNQKFPNFKKLREMFNKKISRIDEDYSKYSGVFHPKTDSFIANLMLIPPSIQGKVLVPPKTRLTQPDFNHLKKHGNIIFSKSYIGNKNLMSDGWRLVTFTNKSVGFNFKKMLEDFMFYSDLIINDLIINNKK